MPLTVKQLLQNVEPGRKDKAKNVVLVGVKPGYLKSGAPKINATAYSTANADGTSNKQKNRYKLVVYGTDPNQRLRDGAVKVSCSCPDFTYTYEVTLKNAGAADIVHSTGEPSDIRNPGQVRGVCCHLARLLVEIARARV